MALLFDILHFVAAALLSVVGLGYEREEECDPVHYQPAAYVIKANDGFQARFIAMSDYEFQTVSNCDSSTQTVTYPVL
ncbi:hypothetical protein NHF45_02975 [Maricaulaceae bacterium NA33B04]|nr:hypothetical protein [Maricaulaceae bacterium NA33B04]